MLTGVRGGRDGGHGLGPKKPSVFCRRYCAVRMCPRLSSTDHSLPAAVANQHSPRQTHDCCPGPWSSSQKHNPWLPPCPEGGGPMFAWWSCDVCVCVDVRIQESPASRLAVGWDTWVALGEMGLGWVSMPCLPNGHPLQSNVSLNSRPAAISPPRCFEHTVFLCASGCEGLDGVSGGGLKRCKGRGNCWAKGRG